MVNVMARKYLAGSKPFSWITNEEKRERLGTKYWSLYSKYIFYGFPWKKITFRHSISRFLLAKNPEFFVGWIYW
jgi:hypothetical protein